MPLVCFVLLQCRVDRESRYGLNSKRTFFNPAALLLIIQFNTLTGLPCRILCSEEVREQRISSGHCRLSTEHGLQLLRGILDFYKCLPGNDFHRGSTSTPIHAGRGTDPGLLRGFFDQCLYLMNKPLGTPSPASGPLANFNDIRGFHCSRPINRNWQSLSLLKTRTVLTTLRMIVNIKFYFFWKKLRIK